MKSFLLQDAEGVSVSSLLVDEVAANMLASTHPALEDSDATSARKAVRDSLHPHYHAYVLCLRDFCGF